MATASRKVLCVCYGNTCRSPMLASLLQVAYQKLHRDVVVESAGLLQQEGQPAAEHAITCMLGRGLDISMHRSRHVGSLDLASYHQIFCVEPKFRDQLLELGVNPARVHVVMAEQDGIPNPWQQDLDAYRHCAEILEATTTDLVALL